MATQMITIYIEALPIETGKINWYEPTLMRTYILPRWIYEKNTRRIKWILARFQYMDPKRHYKLSFAYWLDNGKDLKLFYQLRAAKGELTKWKNKLAEYEKHWQPTLLLTSIELDPKYLAATSKIFAKKCDVERLQKAFDEPNPQPEVAG